MPKHKLLARTALLKERSRQPTPADWLRDGADRVVNNIGTDEPSPSAIPRTKAGGDNEATPSLNQCIKPDIPLEESAGKRFRQNAAIAVIFGLAALTLVLIVHLHP